MKVDDAMRVLLTEQVYLLAYIGAIVQDDALAEEVLQDVAVVLLGAHDPLENEQHARCWLRKTAQYLSLKALRQSARRPIPLDGELLEVLESHWERVDRDGGADRRESLRICLSKLSSYARRIVQLRYGHDLKGQALADAVGRSKQTVYTALTRIHKALSACVQEREQSRLRTG